MPAASSEGRRKDESGRKAESAPAPVIYGPATWFRPIASSRPEDLLTSFLAYNQGDVAFTRTESAG